MLPVNIVSLRSLFSSLTLTLTLTAGEKLVIGTYSVIVLFMKVRFGFSTFGVGVFLATNGVVVALSQGVVVRLCVPRFVSERLAVCGGLVVSTVMYGIMGFADTASPAASQQVARVRTHTQ